MRWVADRRRLPVVIAFRFIVVAKRRFLCPFVLSEVPLSTLAVGVPLDLDNGELAGTNGTGHLGLGDNWFLEADAIIIKVGTQSRRLHYEGRSVTTKLKTSPT